MESKYKYWVFRDKQNKNRVTVIYKIRKNTKELTIANIWFFFIGIKEKKEIKTELNDEEKALIFLKEIHF